MGEKDITYIFHIKRKDGTPLILHAFSTPEKFLYSVENTEIRGRYGDEPRVETLTMFRNELYRMAEAAVKNWIFDQRFIPKFLMSTGIFLVTYFFFSYVVRDPIPMIDETVLGLVAGIASYILLGKKDIASQKAMEKRVEIRNRIDRIKFTESNFVKEVEALLHKSENEKFEEVIKQITAPSNMVSSVSEREEVLQFLKMLEIRFNFKRMKREEKKLKELVRKRNYKSQVSSIKKWMESKKLDYPLYAVYKAFKETISNKR